MALNIAEITDSIAALVVNGVKMCDMNNIPASVTERDCPILFPEPAGFVTDFNVTRDSFGPYAKKTAEYTLHYTFLYMPIGAGRELEKYGAMVETAFAVLDEIIAGENLTGALEMDPLDALEFGPVPDPAGNLFIGCRFALLITEFVN